MEYSVSTAKAAIESLINDKIEVPPMYEGYRSPRRLAAASFFKGEAAPRILRPAITFEIPPHVPHRVEWTDSNEPTVWLAVHAGGDAD